MDEEGDIEIEPQDDVESSHHDGDDAVHKMNKLKDELEKIKKEKQEYLDGWQRAKADYVNALKRFEQEKSHEYSRGTEKAIETLLPAFDALERAKEHGEIPAGFAAIAKQLEGAFTALGLEPVGKRGEHFDPALHEALGQDKIESEAEDDTITAVLESGWRIGNRVVRAAKVRVAHYG